MKTFPKPLSHGEEKLYLKRCKEGDQTARNMLIEHNMRLVAHVVKKYQCQDYDTEALLSAGTIGLIKAVNTFDVDKGSRLATYAARCVENEILMLLRAGKKRAKEVSLFEPIGTDKDGETVSLVDVIEMENPKTIDQLILDQDIKELYQAFDQKLTENEKQVISMRYGLFKGKEHTQREVAGVLGISRSYVSRIEKKAIGKLREEFEKIQ
ncbi:MAG: RNA polymerase sporulation sigma factor SigK [Clostridium sp.]